MNEIEAARWAVAHDLEMTTEALVQRARHLAFRMEQLAQRLDVEDEPRVNQLGEVQRDGAEVDRLCAVLHEQRRTEAVLALLAERSSK